MTLNYFYVLKSRITGKYFKELTESLEIIEVIHPKDAKQFELKYDPINFLNSLPEIKWKKILENGYLVTEIIPK